jgi:hypothetical protein
MSGKVKKRKFYDDKNRQAFVHWRDNTMQHVTAASSVFFGLSAAGMGYVLALLDDETKHLGVAHCWPFRIFAASFALSFLAGIVLVIIRLEDFRKTSNIVKFRDENDEARALNRKIPHPDLDDLRDETSLLGRLTWMFFYVQLAGFGIGGVAFACFIWSLHHLKFTT